jgi:hypothetical protein
MLALCGCDSNANKAGDNSPSKDGTRFFKAQSGEGSEFFPLVGVQEYDNQVTAYSFWRKCDDQSHSAIEIFAGSKDKPIANNEIYGPQMSAPLCSISSTFIYSGGTLSAVGKIDSNLSMDVKFQEISQSEFVKILSSDELGLKDKFAPTATSFGQSNYDRACIDLLGSECKAYF